MVPVRLFLKDKKVRLVAPTATLPEQRLLGSERENLLQRDMAFVPLEYENPTLGSP